MTVCKYKRYHKIIAKAVKENITPAGGIYTNEIIDATGISRETITNWLKAYGFVKSGGHMSRYWVNPTGILPDAGKVPA